MNVSFSFHEYWTGTLMARWAFIPFSFWVMRYRQGGCEILLVALNVGVTVHIGKPIT